MSSNQDHPSIQFHDNGAGSRLAYCATSGVTILTVGGLHFKDLNQSGTLEPYEDWRLPPEVRARDLASRLSIEQIAGLMLYSRHQSIPARPMGPFAPATYGGKPYPDSDAAPWALSDQQVEFVTKDNLRHVLVTSVESPEVAAKWTNQIQALAEGIGFGIPTNNSSDPRHGSVASAEYNFGAGGQISMWPEPLGLAATFDPNLVYQFGTIASIEYRALGITTALSPQIDLATDPRWSRVSGTFGEDPTLVTDMARAYVDGFQTSEGARHIHAGWGYDSVNAMVKHWPGGGSGEGGRDAHFGYGKFAVYPGGQFETHLRPFLHGAFQLTGATGRASAVMPYYTISWNQDPVRGDNVGNAYNAYLIRDLLRETYGYDGVVCTDWLVTADEPPALDLFAGKPWGVEDLSLAERHYRLLMAGVDQFGGNNEGGPILDAYRIGVSKHGEAFMRSRFEQSAVRLLVNMFRVGLFENPYVDVQMSVSQVGSPAFMEAGFEAQLKSVVMVKNHLRTLPIAKGNTVYMPQRIKPAERNWFGQETPATLVDPIHPERLAAYYDRTESPDDAAFALVVIESPHAGSGYSRADVDAGGNGYVPISLQYGPYTAEAARAESIAKDHRHPGDRAYKGKSVVTANQTDLELVRETRRLMKDKPVIVIVRVDNPMVMAEFEGMADAILLHFGVQDQALLEILAGNREPKGLLPMQMPKDMDTVERQAEDVPHDMEVYVDADGSTYDFAFGLDWNGLIQDQRTAHYRR